MNKNNYFILVLILQSWIFFSVLLTTPTQSENLTPKEINLSLKASSTEDFPRILDETQVNYYTINDQQNPSICGLSSDKFAVAWVDQFQDSGTYGVYARVFDAKTGNNKTREFRVNHYTTDAQSSPSICALSSDTFVVTWQSDNQDGPVGSGVYARVFDATTGNNITREFRVNHYTPSFQSGPSICALSSDTFAAAWSSAGQDSATYGVYARVFDATTGNNITREFRVNHYSPNNQYSPSICALSSDTFAVAWSSMGQDTSILGVYARVFNATTGNNITREFRVNYYKPSDQSDPSICALSSNKFAVAWWSNTQDDDGRGVYARVFDATTGNNITREFRVNHNMTNHQSDPSICALSSDKLAVAWYSDGQDGDGRGVYARAFDATTGNAITSEFRVNHNTTSSQDEPSICKLTSDTFAVAWSSAGQDGSGDGVYASVFGNLLPPLPSGDDDDDDDDEEFNILLLSVIIIGIVLVIGIIGIIYLIKKKGR